VHLIDFETYENYVFHVLGRNLEDNSGQFSGVAHDTNEVLMLVAGPGSGKTAVLVLRALRHIFVDDILPENILITTFTKKAAKELKTRWLDWGTLFLEELSNSPDLQVNLTHIDLNRCRIDTLDGISQQALTENRLPGQLAPVLLDESASKLVLKRFAFSEIYNPNKALLDSYFARYSFEGNQPRNRGEALAIAKTLCDRLVQDLVNLETFGSIAHANQIIVEIISNYHLYLREANLCDFALLELQLLERLRSNTLSEWSNSIHALLIDEYQDTNPLQEAIYFEVINSSSPLVTVVGDDDQSLYRFRGGSVELFTRFEARCESATGRASRRVDLSRNYRSSEEIVDFYNNYISGDQNFTPARIVPSKPAVTSQRGLVEMPVLGLFREDPTTLAAALSAWLEELFINRSVTINGDDENYELTLPNDGDLGDCVFLAHTVNEIKYDGYKGESQIRFPGCFRDEMEQRNLQIFNPRGRALRNIRNVQILLGLLLHCLDPEGSYSTQVYPTNEARFFLNEWRQLADSFIDQNPFPSNNGGLQGFVDSWKDVSRGNFGHGFPPDWPVLEIVFKLIAWIPSFQNDPEHQVWLEAITRTISAAGMASPYGMKVLQDESHYIRSRESFIRDALIPIAENEVNVDEEIMPSVPRNYLQLMTIHQAKGLEFPLVIVDVGSQFTRKHHKQAFRRFPSSPSNVVLMEDDVEDHLAQPLRGFRNPIDRSFDDLVRLYYVAYSRPKSVLMLIGCEKCLAYGKGSKYSGSIPNISLGWCRDETWPWRQPFAGRGRPIRVEPPFCLI
jgi:DNA helicase-2/ATP-dependent DNA helicase PcrA